MNRLDLSTTAAGSDLVLAELLDEISMKVKAGESVDREAYLARYPDHAAELGELLDAVLLAAAFGQDEHEVGLGGGARSLLCELISPRPRRTQLPQPISFEQQRDTHTDDERPEEGTKAKDRNL